METLVDTVAGFAVGVLLWLAKTIRDERSRRIDALAREHGDRVVAAISSGETARDAVKGAIDGEVDVTVAQAECRCFRDAIRRAKLLSSPDFDDACESARESLDSAVQLLQLGAEHDDSKDAGRQAACRQLRDFDTRWYPGMARAFRSELKNGPNVSDIAAAFAPGSWMRDDTRRLEQADHSE